MTIYAIRLYDGTLFHSTSLKEMRDYWYKHRENLRYMRTYRDEEVFKREEHPEETSAAE